MMENCWILLNARWLSFVICDSPERMHPVHVEDGLNRSESSRVHLPPASAAAAADEGLIADVRFAGVSREGLLLG